MPSVIEMAPGIFFSFDVLSPDWYFTATGMRRRPDVKTPTEGNAKADALIKRPSQTAAVELGEQLDLL